MTKLKVLDLFSGIGGFSLGLERTGGFETVAFCEIDPFCRRVLAKHWPAVPCFEDVTTLRGEDAGRIDVISGGFPCQDASIGQTQWGKRVGIDGERTGLWRHIARLAAELRDVVLVLENVPGLLSAGFGRVLGDLAEIGFDAEWRCLSAYAAGLPHRRERLCIVAYPRGSRLSRPVGGKSILESAEAALPPHWRRSCWSVAFTGQHYRRPTRPQWAFRWDGAASNKAARQCGDPANPPGHRQRHPRKHEGCSMSHQSKDRAIIQTDREIQAMRKRLERAVNRGLPRKKDRDAAKAFAAVVPLTDAQRSVALKLKQEMRGGR